MDTTGNLRRIRSFEGHRIFLTPECTDDFDNFYRWHNDKEIQAGDGRTYRPMGPEQAREYFKAQLDNKDFIRLSIIMSDSGVQAGRICLYGIEPTHRVASWGLMLDKAFWRQGIGSEAARLVLRYAFDDLGVRKMQSVTNSGNVASARFQESLGFVQEGCLRQAEIINNQIVDRLHYGLFREEFDKVVGKS
ncbi:MAG: GNAT family N-acetyltransferase [candidate division Zixibacteria bacterium]|nr:GNAT family N-acetyltransferase [candidate division Zixibacteria bacterium]